MINTSLNSILRTHRPTCSKKNVWKSFLFPSTFISSSCCAECMLSSFPFSATLLLYSVKCSPKFCVECGAEGMERRRNSREFPLSTSSSSSCFRAVSFLSCQRRRYRKRFPWNVIPSVNMNSRALSRLICSQLSFSNIVVPPDLCSTLGFVSQVRLHHLFTSGGSCIRLFFDSFTRWAMNTHIFECLCYAVSCLLCYYDSRDPSTFNWHLSAEKYWCEN